MRQRSRMLPSQENYREFILRRLESLLTIRTFVCLCVYIFVSFLMAFVQQLSDEFAPFSCDKFDFLFYLLPDLSQYGIVVDMMANLAPVMMCVFIGFFGQGDLGVALRRWFILMSTLYVMRAFCLVGTMETGLPKSDLRFNIGGNKFLGALKIVTLTSHSYTDLMFSGHTCSLLLAFLLYLESGPTNKKIIFFFGVYLLGGIIGLGFCRLHYTNDCVVAIFLTLLLYKCYMDAIKNNKYRIFRWIENGLNKE